MKACRTAFLAVTLVAGLVLPGFEQTAHAAATSWSSAASMPTARAGIASATVNGSIYVLGGYSSSVSVPLTRVERYSPTTNTWTTVASMPTARSFLATASVGGRLYAIGGRTADGYSGVVEVYSPATNSWATVASMPTARAGLAAVAASSGRIYAVGGYTSSGILRSVEVYNPTTNTWSGATQLPFALADMAATLGADGRIDIVGGRTSVGAVATVEAYNPATGSWQLLAHMLAPRTSPAAVTTADGRILAIGGTTSALSPLYTNSVEVYVPATDTWSAAPPLLAPRAELAASTVSGVVYAFGGRGVGASFLNSTEMYGAAVVTPAPNPPVNLQVVPANHQLSVSWTAPSVPPGYLPISDYVVDVYVGSTLVAHQIHVTATSITIQGLTNGTLYTVYVYSVDTSGAVSRAAVVSGTPVVPATVPAAPLTPIVTGALTSVTVTWTAPNNGGSPITGYTVSAYSTGASPVQTVTVPPTVTTFQFVTLPPGTYTFTVVATNAIGTGPASARSASVVIAGVPGAARNLTVTSGDASAVVRWDPPASDGGSAVTGYIVSASDGVHAAITFATASTSVAVTGLTNGVTYTVTVQAVNAVGKGPAITGLATPRNLAPALTVPGAQQVAYSDPLSFTVSASGPEPGDHLVLSASGLPSGLTFVDGGNGTGTLSGAVQAPAGTYPVVFTVNDGHNPAVSQTVTITVTPETANINPAANTPLVVKVDSSGKLNSLKITAMIDQQADGSLGSLAQVGSVAVTLHSMSSSTTITHVVNGSVFGTSVVAKATFKNVPPNMYQVTAEVANPYYAGTGSTALAVIKPGRAVTIKASGNVVSNEAPAVFQVSAGKSKTGTSKGNTVYVEHHAAGDVTVNGSVKAIVTRGSRAYVLARGSMNGTAGYVFVLSLNDHGSATITDQLGQWMVSPHYTVVPGCTFQSSNVASGDVIVR